jgi:hypothetical protein
MNTLNQLTNKFQQHPHMGAQLKHLVLDLHFDANFNLGQFTMLLPNLRFLSCRNKSKSAIHYSNTQPWASCIEHMMDENDDALIPQLFLSNTHFSCLKRLEIKNLDIHKEGFIELLPHVSALSHLKLKCNSISFAQIELLHSNLPLLESLDLKLDCAFSFNQPYNIKPANTITSFSLYFDDLVTMDTEMKWFAYIRQKYTNMSSFTFSTSQRVAGCVDMEDFYRGWFDPLFQYFGPQLKSLSLHSHQTPSHLIKILDQSGCQIKHLKIRLAKPRLLEYFHDAQNLDQIETFEIESDICTAFEWMRKMTSLQELSIFYLSSQPNFDPRSLLDVCSDTLTTLSIWIKCFGINGKPIDKVYPSIKSMSLFETILPLKFSPFISESFPNLRCLKLSECHFPENTLRLYDLRLDHFEIEVCHFEKEYDLRVVTLNNNEQRLYTFKLGHNRPFYPEKNRHLYRAPFTFVPYKDTERTPTLTLFCYSVCSVSVLYKYF